MVVFFNPFFIKVYVMTQCTPLQISFTADNKTIIDLETPIDKDNDELKFQIITAVGRDFLLHTVNILEDNKIQITLLERF